MIRDGYREKGKGFGAGWFRDLDSNQDTQLQRLMSYRLDDPGIDSRIVAEPRNAPKRPNFLPSSELVVQPSDAIRETTSWPLWYFEVSDLLVAF